MKQLYNTIKNLEISYTITQAVHKFLNLEDVFKVALDMTIDLPDVDMAFIYLIDFRKNEAVLRAHRNLPDFYIRGAGRIPYPKGITWRIIESGNILRVKNIQNQPHVGPSGRKLGHQGVLGLPITIDAKVIGVLYFATYKERHFSDQAVDLLTSIGNQIAIAVAKAQLYRELSRKNQYKTIAVIISKAVHKSIDLIDILENSVESMIENLNNADNIDIYLIEKTKAVLKVW